jgi:hypothetical protein
LVRGSGREIGDADREHFAIGLHDREGSIGGELQSPAILVNHVMMARAQRKQVGQIGLAAEFPRDDVVDLATVEHDVAAVERTTSVDRP